jgi:hypothetical protein
VDGSPTNGTLTLNVDGSFSYTPNANFAGSDTFSYHANDGTADSNVATVIINITSVVTVTSIDPPSVPRDNTIGVTIYGSGFMDGASVTFENGSGPAPTASSIDVASDGKSLTATVTVKSGGRKVDLPWDVSVTNPDGSSAVLAAGFTVQ